MLQHRLGNGLGQDRNACFLQPGSLLVIKLRAHEQKKPRRAALCDFLRESQRAFFLHRGIDDEQIHFACQQGASGRCDRSGEEDRRKGIPRKHFPQDPGGYLTV